MTADKKTYYCDKCHKTMTADSFYVSNNKEKYKNDGVLNQCKKCITMHVDNWDPNTYLWILQECDVPYIPDEWNRLMERYAKDASKVTGSTILGRYLSKMKLKQYKDYRWKDNEFLKQLNEKRIKETLQGNGRDIQEIEKVIQEIDYELPPEEIAIPVYEDEPMPEEFGEMPSPNFVPEPEMDLGLTPEDITYLRLKWGKNYKQEEWVQLEQLYNEMMESYDIQTAGHIDTLKLVCKTSLKANQLIDIGDIDGYQKVSKVYDNLMKSGNFTAVQNKTEQGEYIDSISEFVALCEKDGFIPKYYVDGPQDKVDRVIEDMQYYVKTLVTEEMGLGNLIENAVKKIEQRQANEVQESADGDDIDMDEENKLFDYNNNIITTDEDFQEFYDWEDDEEKANEDFLNSFFKEEGQK